MIAGQAGLTDYKMKKILGNHYIRLETDLDDANLPANAQPSAAIDDATPENMSSINRYARFLIDNKEEELNHLYKTLNDDFRHYPRKKVKTRFWGFGRNEDADKAKKQMPEGAKNKNNNKPKKSIFNLNSKH